MKLIFEYDLEHIPEEIKYADDEEIKRFVFTNENYHHIIWESRVTIWRGDNENRNRLR